jgi:MFS family permease
MFPVVAISLLGGDAVTLGLLGTFRGLGGVIGALFISSFGDIRVKGSILWGSAFLFGLFLIVFSFSRNTFLSYFLISTIGFVAIMYNTQAQSLLQILTPDAMRGRVMGIHSVLLTGIGFGALGMGAIAGWLGVNWAIFGGGGLVATNALINVSTAPIVNREAGGS